MSTFSFKETFSVTIILFSILDIVGSVPFVLNFKKKVKSINVLKVTLFTGFLLLLYLFIGESILKLFGVDVKSFAVAGGFILFLIGLEMIVGIEIFKLPHVQTNGAFLIPLAFPLYAGAGSMTTLISLGSEYAKINIILAILINLGFIFTVLKLSDPLDRKLGDSGALVLRKFFGIVLIAIAIKLVKTNLLMA